MAKNTIPLSSVSLDSIFTDREDPPQTGDDENPTQPVATDQPDDEAQTPDVQDEQAPDQDQDQEVVQEDDSADQQLEATNDEAEPSQDDDSKFFNQLSEQLGIDLDDEFEFTEQGISSFIEKASLQISTFKFKEALEQYPDVNEYLSFRINGGTQAQYYALQSQQVQYENMTIGSDDLSTQKHIIRQDLIDQGYEEQEAIDYVSELEASGMLFKRSEMSLKRLQKKSKEETERQRINQEAERQKQQEQDQQMWTNMQQVVDSGNAKGIVIPSSNRRKFWEWMAKPIDNKGTTQRMKDRAEMNIEEIVALEYLAFTGINLTELVQRAKNTDKAKNLKERLKRNQAPSSSTRMSGSSSKTKGAGKDKKLLSFNEMI